jgi:hypothetical protein
MYSVSSVLMIAPRKPDSQSFQQLLSNVPHAIKKSTMKGPTKKRNSTFGVIRAKRGSRTHGSRSPELTYSTARNASLPTTEIAFTPNESSVNHELTDVSQSEVPASEISDSQVPINRTSATSSVRPVLA